MTKTTELLRKPVQRQGRTLGSDIKEQVDVGVIAFFETDNKTRLLVTRKGGLKYDFPVVSSDNSNDVFEIRAESGARLQLVRKEHVGTFDGIEYYLCYSSEEAVLGFLKAAIDYSLVGFAAVQGNLPHHDLEMILLSGYQAWHTS